MFLQNERLGTLFEKTAAFAPAARKLTANYIGSDIAGLITKHGDSGLSNIRPEGLGSIMQAAALGAISSRGAKDAIAEVFEKGGDLAEVAKKYVQQSDEGALKTIVEKVIAANPNVVADYKAGKQAALQFLVGQGMKESRGSANPTVLAELVKKSLA